jgi:inorganic pyrophosphatase
VTQTISKDAVPRMDYRVRRRRSGERVHLVYRNRFHELDALSDAVWLAGEQGLSIEQICHRLESRHALPLDEAIAATMASLEWFHSLGFVEYVSQSPRDAARSRAAAPLLGARVRVRVDRPMGSSHPEHGFLYPLNYGYVPGVPAEDGDDVDAYVLGVFEPVEIFTGRCIAVIERLDDLEDKLVVCPEDARFTADQIAALVEFQERFFTTRIVTA